MPSPYRYDFIVEAQSATGRLPDGSTFFIDVDQIPVVESYAWHINKDGYACTYNREKKSMLLLHRLLLGEKDSTVIVDHINHNRLDCRLANLRKATPHQNSSNHKEFCTNKTGYTGVYYSNCAKRFECKIGYFGKRILLGCSVDCPERLAQYYNTAAIFLYREYAGTLNPVMLLSEDDAARIENKCAHYRSKIDALQCRKVA